MRAAWCVLWIGAAYGCAEKPRAAPPEVSVQVQAPPVVVTAPTPVATAEPTSAPNTALVGGPRTLPPVCEAYFAKMAQCIEASLSKHPDEATRAQVRKEFEKAEQKSRALMAVSMETKD